jgi:hypothetical protein
MPVPASQCTLRPMPAMWTPAQRQRNTRVPVLKQGVRMSGPACIQRKRVLRGPGRDSGNSGSVQRSSLIHFILQADF